MDLGTWDEAYAQLHPHRDLPAGGAVPHPEIREQSATVASRHEWEWRSIKARVVRDAGSVLREEQGIRGQGDVSDARLHVCYKADGGDGATSRGEAVIWWWRLLRLAWLRAEWAAHRSTFRRARDLQPADKHTSKPLEGLKKQIHHLLSKIKKTF